MASSVSLPFFVRDRDCIKVLRLDPTNDEAGTMTVTPEENSFALPKDKVKVATWSPDGMALALVDPAAGVSVVDLTETEGPANNFEPVLIPHSSKQTQGMYWSPLGSNLVTIAALPKGSTEPNLQVWRRNGSGGCESGGGTGEYLCAASFVHPKLAHDRQVVKWTTDETYCGRITPDGKVHMHDGTDLASQPIVEFELQGSVQNFEFAPITARLPLKARLAIFVPDSRDDLQRVAAPAEVSVWEVLSSGGSGLEPPTKQMRVAASVASGQTAELKWSPTGTAVLAHCMTEVDESGKSYYGASKLMLVSYDGAYQKDLTEADETTDNRGTSVQAVAWSPTRDEFILIRGFQPAQVTLWSWDMKAQRASMVKVLLEKAHRNTIRFNLFGSLVCLAGFGNLAGEIDFFGRLDDERGCDYAKVSSCVANCTVSAEWAPDGRHLLTAVLFPRMRVDNGLHIWRALSGTKVCENNVEELYEVQWRPVPPNDLRFLDVAPEEVQRATQGHANRLQVTAKEKKQAYRPPKARAGESSSTVAAMMRGEVAAPDGDDRRGGRRPWQPRARGDQPEGDAPPAPSPTMSPAKPPAKAPPEDLEMVLPPPSPPPPSAAPAPSTPSVPRVPPPQRPPPPPEPVPSAPWAQQERTSGRENPVPVPAKPVAVPREPSGNSLPTPVASPGQSAMVEPVPASAPVPPPPHPPAPAQPSPMQPPVNPPVQPPTQPAVQQHQAMGPSPIIGGPPAGPPARRRAQDQQAPAMAGYPGQPQRPGQPGQPGQLAQPPINYTEHVQYLTQQQRQQQAQQMQQAQTLAEQQAAAAALQYARQPQPTLQQQHQDAMQRANFPHHPQPHPQQQQQPRQAPQPQDSSLRLDTRNKALQVPVQQAQVPANQANKRECPSTGWQYVDPKGIVQGPFTLLEMKLWNSMGYFRPELLMRCDPADAFVEFNKLFPHPLVPFESYPRRVPQNGSTVGVGGR